MGRTVDVTGASHDEHDEREDCGDWMDNENRSKGVSNTVRQRKGGLLTAGQFHYKNGLANVITGRI